MGEDRKYQYDAPASTKSGSIRRTIEQWIQVEVAHSLHVSPSAVPMDVPLHDVGLDSQALVTLTEKLRGHCHQELPVTFLWDNPTVFQAAAAIAGDSTGVTPVARGNVEPIAIVGIGLRFPRAESPDELWTLLTSGQTAIDGWPTDRPHRPDGWSFPPFGGFLSDIDKFDPGFFGLSDREARHMDPQQRLLLETAWHALEDGGMAPDSLSEREIGSFIGISTNDYGHDGIASAETVGPFLASGNAKSIAANRIAYSFDLTGPSMAIDTACSSSLVAVHQACEALRAGDCTAALAGGVNLILRPETSAGLAAAGMLAPDGHCKPFDARANGYVRSEGCAIVLLKPLNVAKREGHRILGVILGSAVNHDGRTNGLTAPSGRAQQQVIQRALARAGITPEAIAAIEAHGTGTAIGDAVEIGAIEAVFGGGNRSRPLLVGGIKASIGHLEAAAGIAGLIKAVLCLDRGIFPEQAGFQTLNPALAFGEKTLRIATSTTSLENGTDPIRIGVSSFGFGGTNVHLIVEQAADQQGAGAANTLVAEGPHAIPVAARSAAGLSSLSGQYADWLEARADVDIGTFASLMAARSGFPWREILVVNDRSDLLEKLRKLASRQAPSARVAPSSDLIFDFGRGQFDREDGQELFETEPVFRESMLACESVLSRGADESLINRLYDEGWPDTGPILPGDCTLSVAMLIAAANLWQSWGLKPAGAIGTGVGALAAAWFNGEYDDRTLLGFDLAAADAEDGAQFAPLINDTTVGAAIHFPLSRPGAANIGERCANGSALRRYLADCLSRLDAAGHEFDWPRIHRGGRARSGELPPHPFERRSLWYPKTETPVREPENPAPHIQPYRLRWDDVSPSVSERPEDASLIIAGDGPLAESLAADWRARGKPTTLLPFRDSSAADLAASIAEATRVVENRADIVFLPACDDDAVPESTVTKICQTGETLASGLNAWKQSGVTGRTVVVVPAAFDLTIGECGLSPSAAFVAALSNSLCDALPGPSLIVDPGHGLAVQRAALLEMLVGEWRAEGRLAWRNGRPYAPRLTVAQEGVGHGAVTIDPSGTYLVTGGAGAAGLRIVEWLVNSGARKLLLLQRHKPVGQSGFDAARERWRTLGVSVRTMEVDVSNREQLSAALKAHDEPVRGIVHAAGQLERCDLATTDARKLKNLLAPKLLGAWLLDELVPDPDFSILISSISGAWNAPGLAGYGAANAALDAFAATSNRRGRRIVATAFGPLKGGAMVSAAQQDELAKLGLHSIRGEDMAVCLDKALASAAPYTIFAAIDWSRFHPAMTARRPDNLFSPFAAPVANRTRAHPVKQARVNIRRMISEIVSDMLGISDPTEIDWERGFFDLGLDSQSVLVLRDDLSRSLGIDLPASIAFDYPTMNELLAFIENAYVRSRIGTSPVPS